MVFSSQALVIFASLGHPLWVAWFDWKRIVTDNWWFCHLLNFSVGISWTTFLISQFLRNASSHSHSPPALQQTQNFLLLEVLLNVIFWFCLSLPPGRMDKSWTFKEEWMIYKNIVYGNYQNSFLGNLSLWIVFLDFFFKSMKWWSKL